MSLLLTVVAVLLAQAPPDPGAPTPAPCFESTAAWDIEALRRCRLNVEPTESYTLAYLDWRESQLLPESDKQRKKLLKRARSTLVSIVDEAPEDVEALSLLGGVYGSQIRGAWSGMTLGPKSAKLLARAESLAPDNPRVLLQLGVSAFRTPENFGGSVERAEKLLKRAEQRFDGESQRGPWPNWGRVSTQGFLGQVLAERGDLAGARKAYEKGLKLAPDAAWIREQLLPRLAKLEAAAND